MKRKYKICLIILSAFIISCCIYFTFREDKINIVALGDGVASGETAYNIDGISYNDYLQEYFEDKHLLKSYNNSFTSDNYLLTDLLNDIKSNILKIDKKSIQQIIHESHLLTVSIGEDELVKLALTNDLNKENINKFILEYDNLIHLITNISNTKIVIISFYENNYLTKSNVILLNSKLSDIALKYNCIFINISDLMLNNDYYLNNKDYHFNYKGHKEIAKLIIHSI